MTFLVLDVQKNFMVQQKSRLEYEQTICSSSLQSVNGNMQNLVNQSVNGDVDLENNRDYVSLQLLSQSLDTTNASLESQLKVLNTQIESFTKAIDNNIKSGCKLNLLS